MTDLPCEQNTSSPQADKASFVQALFNRIAPTYNLLNDLISFGLHRGWKRKACQKLQLQPGDHVLDVCTGTGHLMAYLLPLVGVSGKATGLDFSEAMLAVAKKTYTQNANVFWDQGDALNLPYPDNTFDGAIVAFGLRNVSDHAKTIEEMKRVVKPGCRVVCLETNPNPKLPGFWFYFNHIMPRIGHLLSGEGDAYRYLHQSTKTFLSPTALEQLFITAGLQEVQLKPLSLGACAVCCGKKATH